MIFSLISLGEAGFFLQANTAGTYRQTVQHLRRLFQMKRTIRTYITSLQMDIQLEEVAAAN